jgi:hypothetical protein
MVASIPLSNFANFKNKIGKNQVNILFFPLAWGTS